MYVSRLQSLIKGIVEISRRRRFTGLQFSCSAVFPFHHTAGVSAGGILLVLTLTVVVVVVGGGRDRGRGLDYHPRVLGALIDKNPWKV